MTFSITSPHSNDCRKIWFYLILTAGLLSAFSCASADEGVDLQHAPDECPHYTDFNPTTIHYHIGSESWGPGLEQVAFESDQYSKSRLDAGLRARYQPDEYRLLETARDRDACIALNKTYYTHRSRMYASVDGSTGRRVPERYAMYYKVPGRYVVLYAPYSQGPSNPGEIGPPSLGFIFVSVYDDRDFSEIGGFTM